MGHRILYIPVAGYHGSVVDRQELRSISGDVEVEGWWRPEFVRDVLDAFSLDRDTFELRAICDDIQSQRAQVSDSLLVGLAMILAGNSEIEALL